MARNDKGTAMRGPELSRIDVSGFDCVALVLQGGGALGAYQAGVLEGLAQRGITPDWVAGISIGAINCAIIAGNAPEKRVERLREFWNLVSQRDSCLGMNWIFSPPDAIRTMINLGASFSAASIGVPGFFEPRFPPPVLSAGGGEGATAWYDTSPLRSTLESLVDFDRINSGEMRFSVGAVNVASGNFRFFDNTTDKIGPEHVMASGALPPGLPAIRIDGEYYWDGGLVSNTPLDWIIDNQQNADTLVFQIDLWSAKGTVPQTLDAVASRIKEIQFSSRTRFSTGRFREMQKIREAYARLYAKMPEELRDSDDARLLVGQPDPGRYNIAQMIYTPSVWEGQTRDYEFSRRTMNEHWQRGVHDAAATLAHPGVTDPAHNGETIRTFDYTSIGKKD